jgi:sugar phosphate isomerase/epimerase
MGKMGIQLFSVWQYAEKDYLGTVKKLADLGYEGIQFFANFYNTPAAELRSTIDEKGVVPAGSHVGIDQLTEDKLEKTFQYHQTIGNDLIICPGLPREMRDTADAYKKTAETFNQIGEACQKAGFTFGYHNHDFEFDVMDGKTGFDLLFENTDPALVKVELDCYWAAYADQDPLQILSKYEDRVISLHLKDMKLNDGKKMGTEIGTGILDIEKIVEVGKSYGVSWYTVEQEEFEMDPYESLHINATNLKAILDKTGA